MPITPEHVGRTYPSTPPYEVSAAKIGEYAAAIGDDSSAYVGDQAIAPPTFVSMIVQPAWDVLFDDPDLGVALRRIVHAEQRYAYRRPLRVGDRLVTAVTIDKVRNRDAADFITASVQVATVDGEPVCTATATFVHTKEQPS